MCRVHQDPAADVLSGAFPCIPKMLCNTFLYILNNFNSRTTIFLHSSVCRYFQNLHFISPNIFRLRKSRATTILSLPIQSGRYSASWLRTLMLSNCRRRVLLGQNPLDTELMLRRGPGAHIMGVQTQGMRNFRIYSLKLDGKKYKILEGYYRQQNRQVQGGVEAGLTKAILQNGQSVGNLV